MKDRLHNAAIDCLLWLSRRCTELAMHLSGHNPDAAPERRIEAERLVLRAQHVDEHPCPACFGLCVIETPDNTVELCPACAGYGVDLQWLAGSVAL